MDLAVCNKRVSFIHYNSETATALEVAHDADQKQQQQQQQSIVTQQWNVRVGDYDIIGYRFNNNQFIIRMPLSN